MARPRPGQLPTLDRRSVLKVLLAGAGLAAVPGLAACGSGGSTAADPNTVTFGSNGSDAKPKQAYQAVLDAFAKQSGGLKAKPNVQDHQAFQQNINSYLQGTPDDVFTWFAGYRMQFFANKNLLSPIDDVWDKIGANFPQAVKDLSKNPQDGHYYFVPIYNYPWGVFYRKSLFQEKGYTVPKTFDDFINLAKKMQGDGLSPFVQGFGGGESWMLLGTFDYLNMRTNGYQFHMDLMHGKESWSDKKVKDVMDSWKRMLPYYQAGASSKKWEDASAALVNKTGGMMVIGMFVGQSFTNQADYEDLDFFAFPEINSQYGTDAVEAPMDGFLLSKNPKNPDGAKKLLEYLGSAEAENTYLSIDSSNLAVNDKADTSKYGTLQKKAVQFVADAKQLSQFGDRDSDPGFIQNVVEPAFAQFVQNPNTSDSLLTQIQSQKSQYFQS
ncbi:ABC transporter substrate-binding protein [Kutzneria kofuensis]|uniref:Multiple sugar transport system substrate-binding protein n=1 Tax=Kutzneria kofuensis TaxID=103725 RepID=A0A7W9KGV8_9PSEU|nr:ABC transporter substrate-binding protein [Kutzneria kofuensis]MBB5891978.1 multiple sugar transport system substrate-binding protein [Kutzneria kofuensis]